ncbi:hypothetical protein DRZ77_02750 [Candidatus Woesearchaeota archaeon]|nr:hypothetical protein [Candidatus Woesearchaeota archaeon]RLE40223.1 MAG: hypothetical protein DRZ77_02750 [Candidatus Woesearchaeota archaeon]
MINDELIIKTIRMKGPVLPVDIAKVIGKDLIITAAHLSEMVRRGLIKSTYARIGGSILYYLPGQEQKLESLIVENLNPKDRETLSLLKEKKVLRDDELTPLQRVSIRNLKDFAKPLSVNTENKQILFWRWHLFPTEQAKETIRKILSPKPEPEQKIKKPRLKQAYDKDFFEKVKNAVENDGIKILKSNEIKKAREFELTLSIPTPLGNVKAFAIAKNKSKINENDVLSLFVKSNQKKASLCVLLTNGNPSKKALEKINELNIKLVKINGSKLGLVDKGQRNINQ